MNIGGIPDRNWQRNRKKKATENPLEAAMTEKYRMQDISEGEQ